MSEYINVPELRGLAITEPIDTYVVLDIETTGLKYSDDIIEFAAIKIENNNLIGKMSFLLKPEKSVPCHITDLTGIDHMMLSTALPFSEHIDEILSFIGEDVIIGHNIIFDIDRLNYKLYTLLKRSIDNNYSDTKQLARQRIHDIENYRLATIAQRLNVRVENAHRALDDCYTTWKCYEQLIKLPCLDGYPINQITSCSAAYRSNNHVRQKDIQPNNYYFNETHVLYNETIVITGTLHTMTRAEAYQKIKNVGGLCGDTVTKKTNYLVTNSITMTGKMKKALQYKDQGQDIEIIDEQRLIELLRG